MIMKNTVEINFFDSVFLSENPIIISLFNSEEYSSNSIKKEGRFQ